MDLGGEEGTGQLFETFGGAEAFARRVRPFTARGGTSLFESDFAADDVLVFGSESAGLPPDFLERHSARRVYIPIRAGVRSLNLANTISLGLYTALARAGLVAPGGTVGAIPQP